MAESPAAERDVPEQATTPIPPTAISTEPTDGRHADAIPDLVPGPEQAAPTAESNAPTGAPPTIVIESVARRFGDVVAVDGLSLVIPGGVILGIIGPSGSGKTTTIRMLTGALRPDDGTVTVLGKDPTRFDRATRERIGYLPQLSVLFPELTAWENVDFVASLFGMLLPRRVGAVRRVLKVLDLWGEHDRQVRGFSGGMQRRVALACALVGEPEVLFLDEPTTGIDPILRESIWAELARLRDAGRTILVTTQYVTEAEECDQVALIAEGRLIALGTPDELRARANGGTPPTDDDARKSFDEVFADLVRQQTDDDGKAAPRDREKAEARSA
jgi:ABC-2 type transport system ATP-binding protein